jgi:5'-nucleotidase
MSIRRGVGVRVWSALGALVFAIGLAASGCGDDGGDEPNPPGEVGGAGGEGGEPGRGSNRPPQKLVILHTNDLHSHLMGHAPEADYTPATTNDDATHGGAARLASAIARARARARSADVEVLLLDAGDFMMGTLFELLATEQASELSLFQTLGYDAITLGNHEFDWTPAGLAAILAAGSQRGVRVPIVSSNMKFSVADRADDGLEALAIAGVIQPKLVKQVGTLKVGFFGLLGANAAQVTPQAAPLTFEPILDASSRMVAELRQTDEVDLVIALSHSGISARGIGEDADLAATIPGIDVIVSGHTHDSLEEPVRVGNTWIVTAGSYGRHLGELELTVMPAVRAGAPPVTEVEDYTLLDIDDSIEGDAEVQATVDAYIDDIDAALESAGLSYRQIVATTPGDLELPAYAEAPLGNLVADAYRTIAAALDPEDPPAIGVDANGQLRAPLIRGETGEVWLADLFRILPTGIGPDEKPGFPLVSFYLNASDIRSGLELGAGKNVVSNDFFLQISGLKVEYDMSKPLFGRVASLALVTENGEEALDLSDTNTCYKVVTTSYVAGLLGVVKALTVGLLAVEAKDSDCETLVDPTTRFIDADPTTRPVEELKQWQALLRFVVNLPDSDGDRLPNIPELYVSPQDRIVER